jgi:hypothetical protein
MNAAFFSLVIFLLFSGFQQINFIYYSTKERTVYGSTALCWTLADFQFLNPIHSRQHSPDAGSTRRKAATYTQNNTNIE